MWLVTDIGIRHKEAYIERLSLGSKTLTAQLESDRRFVDLGSADRVVFVASLENGGYRYQLDLIRGNRKVDEWIILSEGTSEDSIRYFLGQLSVTAKVSVFTNDEQVKAALSRPSVQQNACLLLAMNDTVDISGFQAFMKNLLPDWTFCPAVCTDVRQALQNNVCARTILIGKKLSDFFAISLPDEDRPLIVMTEMENDAFDSIHIDAFRRRVRDRLGFGWGDDMLRKQVYMVSVQYEGWRLTQEPTVLINDERFVMWDEFGLPAPRSVYTSDSIQSFLSRFDQCSQIAERLRERI